MKRKDLWVIEEKLSDRDTEVIAKNGYSSLSKALHSFIRKLTGIKMFYLITAQGKVFVAHKQDGENEG